ncbi:hypothetical protein PUN28_004004 [Cardiocondyla obscurior]|uniref:Uncharacterized protein n=1 Tax=Cardiocondyla obscurior TaxID=286306 RepID=A0AAW2GNZ8_9HYME
MLSQINIARNFSNFPRLRIYNFGTRTPFILSRSGFPAEATSRSLKPIIYPRWGHNRATKC